jgi:hypothetical protein
VNTKSPANTPNITNAVVDESMVEIIDHTGIYLCSKTII